MSDVTIIGLLIACIVVLFISDRLPVVVVAMATPLALWATGLLSLEKALSGFGDPAVIFIAALFVVSAGLERSGVTAWAGQLLIAGGRDQGREWRHRRGEIQPRTGLSPVQPGQEKRAPARRAGRACCC